MVGAERRSTRSRSPAPRGATSGTTTGKRYLDFASQLVNVNIGHQHPKIVRRSRTRPTSSARSGRRWRTSRARGSGGCSPRSRPATSRCRSSRTAAPRRTRTRSSSRGSYTGAHKIIARYRSYHGATNGAVTLTGDPRRWAGRARDARRRAHVRPVHVSLPRRPSRPVPGLHGRAAPRGDPRVRGAADRRRGDPRDGDRDERRHSAARRLSAVDPRGLRPARDPADPRRGDGGLRPHGPLVRVRATGTSSRTSSPSRRGSTRATSRSAR